MDNVTFEKGLATASGWVTAYSADPLTGEFIMENQEYVTDGVGLPAFSTLDAPPETTAGTVACLTADGTGWEVVSDYRGKDAWRRADRQAVVITTIGPLDDSLTFDAPLTDFDVWQDTAWVTDTAAQKAAQVEAAEAMRASKLAEVSSVTQMWQTQLALGMLSDTDKEKLVAWMNYANALQAVDTTLAPYIDWPDRP